MAPEKKNKIIYWLGSSGVVVICSLLFYGGGFYSETKSTTKNQTTFAIEFHDELKIIYGKLSHLESAFMRKAISDSVERVTSERIRNERENNFHERTIKTIKSFHR